MANLDDLHNVKFVVEKFSCADDSTLLKIVPLREACKLLQGRLILIWMLLLLGNRWHIEFEPAELSTVCISLKQDLKGTMHCLRSRLSF